MLDLQNPWFIPVYIFFAILLGAMAWNIIKFIYFIITFKGKKSAKKTIKK